MRNRAFWTDVTPKMNETRRRGLCCGWGPRGDSIIRHVTGPTRRMLLAAPLCAAASSLPGAPPRAVPVRLIEDSRVPWSRDRLAWFRSRLWPEAAGNLARGGIRLNVVKAPGEVERPPGREPLLKGIQRGVLNFIVTSHIPVQWDGGRGLCGVTTLYRGFHVSMVALSLAQEHQIPFPSVNSCLHELLHALLGDIYEARPPGVRGQWRALTSSPPEPSPPPPGTAAPAR